MAELEITHPDELLGLSTLPLRRHRGVGPITIADRRVEPAARERWEAKLNKLYFACGCPEGTIGLIVGLAAYALVVAIAQPGIGSVLGHAGFGLLAAAVGSAAGKLAGLVRANAGLKEVVAEVRSEWDAPVREEKELYTCG